MIISFGQIRGAEFWLEETGCVFDMLLDPERKVRVKGVCRFEKNIKIVCVSLQDLRINRTWAVNSKDLGHQCYVLLR